jgi:diguanylate cyclase (GGDEF)-like protein/PAS domain S-box-containing protein
MDNVNIKSALQSEQLRQMLATGNVSLSVSIFLAAILAYVQRDLIAITVLVPWFFLLLLVSLLRASVVIYFQRNPLADFAAMRMRLLQMRGLVLLCGLLWGAAGVLLFPAEDHQHQLFLIFMLAGLSLGGVISFSADLFSAVVYPSAALLPLLLGLVLSQESLALEMCLAGALYLVFLILFVRHLNQSLSENIVRRIEAVAHEESVRLSEERYRLLLQHAPVGIFHFNSELVISYCNKTMLDLLHSTFEVVENFDMNLLSDRSIIPSCQKALGGEIGRYEGQYQATYSEVTLWIVLICAPSRDINGKVVGGIGIVQDMTERKTAANEINNLAYYDPLTQLPNRRLLLDRLKQALASSARSGRSAALLIIDLDNFKNINDTFGHEVGDLLLQQVGQRIEQSLREVDMVAHLSGDEFVVILEYLSEQLLEAAKQTESVGEKIRRALCLPYLLHGHEHHSTPSIGATLFNGGDLLADDLMKQADIAMYQAKKSGRNNLRFFDPRMQEEIDAHAELEGELHKAIENAEFQLYYQVQVDSQQRALGAEVLIRWLHPQRGLVSPAKFIPLAEETGLILHMGQWVLETACDQIKAWQKNEQTRHLALSVNISATQFRQPDFVANVQLALNRHVINPRLLKLELTESLLLDDIERTIETMNELKDIGIQFSLDDFGTGYSSLQYLKRLPLTQLKIDQSFVRDLVSDSSDKVIVSTIIAMAHSLGLDVIAEGVETEEQQKFLYDNNCLHYQGYLFGKPVPLAQFEVLLQQQGQLSDCV